GHDGRWRPIRGGISLRPVRRTAARRVRAAGFDGGRGGDLALRPTSAGFAEGTRGRARTMTMARKAEVVRETKETQIRVSIDLDGTGVSKITTGVGFFDHMLESFARHGGF